MKKVVTCFWNMIEKIVVWCLELLFCILHKELTTETKAAFMQFVRFGIVGASNTIISYVVYSISLLAMRATSVDWKYDYFAANILAFVLSVLWSFYWSNKYVFTIEEGEHRSPWRALIKTFISYSFTGLFLSNILLVFWVQILGISEFLSPLFTLIISIPINFLINKFWAYKKEER